MKRVINLLWTLLFVVTMNAKNSYYYYNGNRINLTISDDSVSIYTETNSKLNYQLEYRSQTISLNEIKDIKNHTITSIEYVIIGDDNHSVKMSNRFYVQLFDSIADVSKLQTIARETNAIILGQVPNIPDWYELVVHNSVINNSLELSNYFFETGLFKGVDPGFIFHFTSSTACVSDSYFNSQWGMSAVNACDAWDITKGNSNVKIAIIDKGVQRQHSEFQFNQFTDMYDCNSRTSSGYQVYDAHGTLVCGVISSDHNHSRIAGIAPNCTIIPISFCITDTTVAAANLASGFAWAVSHGADVINCSWGDQHKYTWLHCPLLESTIHNAITNGRNGKGCVVVFGAGNINSYTLDYPAYIFPEIITVGAIKNDNSRWEYIPPKGSSYGYDLDVMAPGCNIYTTNITGWEYASGTSLAAPLVSGIAALILSVNPYLTQKEVADIIESTAQKVQPDNTNYNYYNYANIEGRPNGKWDFEMGYGLVNAYAAVLKAQNTGIRGPEKMCGIAKYYLMRPSQPNETVNWSVQNGEIWNPYFSIIGSTHRDTVLIQYDDVRLDPHFGDSTIFLDNGKYLSVTISNGSISKSYQKSLKKEQADIPTIMPSNSNTIWYGNTQRTFMVSNSFSTPDSLFKWTVKSTLQITGSNLPQVTTVNYYYGRTLSLTVPNPPAIAEISMEVYVTNMSYECGEVNSNSLQYVIRRNISLIAQYIDDSELELVISEEGDGTSKMLLPYSNENHYTLEIWHSVYGCIQTVQMEKSREHISTRNFPQGFYVALLKQDNSIVAQTKFNVK